MEKVLCSNYFPGLDFLHNKCKLVHGDLSINNIVIFRDPSVQSHTKAPAHRKGSAQVSSTSTRVTRNTTRQQQALLAPAPLTGIDDNLPVVGTVIDYDYSRAVNTPLDKTSVRLQVK